MLHFIIPLYLSCSIVNASNIKAEGYCPFGICKGIDPTVLYKDDKRAKLMMNSYIAGGFPIVNHLSFIDKYLNIHPSDGIDYSVFYSQETGVCAARLDLILHDSVAEEFVDEMKQYLFAELNNKPVFGKPHGEDIIYWTDEKIDKPSISLVGFRYAFPSSKDYSMFVAILEYRFDNFSTCIKVNPEIPQ